MFIYLRSYHTLLCSLSAFLLPLVKISKQIFQNKDDNGIHIGPPIKSLHHCGCSSPSHWRTILLPKKEKLPTRSSPGPSFHRQCNSREKQSTLAQSTPLGMSTNYFFGKFILYIYSTELSHKVFSNARPDTFHIVVHPFGQKLFAETSPVYQFGQEHKDLRRRVVNFTPKGLATYSSIQQRIILKHLKSWLLLIKSDQKPIPLRLLCREMNLETSQTVFVGPYLSDEAQKIFDIGYSFFNQGEMTLPIDLPGFGFRKS